MARLGNVKRGVKSEIVGIQRLTNNLEKLTQIEHKIGEIGVTKSRPASWIVANLKASNTRASRTALGIALDLYSTGQINQDELRKLRKRIFEAHYRNEMNLYKKMRRGG